MLFIVAIEIVYIVSNILIYFILCLLTNYYKKYEKGIIWWQSLYRMHLSRKNSL